MKFIQVNEYMYKVTKDEIKLIWYAHVIIRNSNFEESVKVINTK